VRAYSFRLLNYFDLEVYLQDILWSIQQHGNSSSYLHEYVLCIDLIHVLFIGKCVCEERPKLSETQTETEMRCKEASAVSIAGSVLSVQIPGFVMRHIICKLFIRLKGGVVKDAHTIVVFHFCF